MKPEDDQDTFEFDPIFVSSRREAIVSLALFGIFLIYVLSTSFWLGIQPATHADGTIATILGMPSWVFWGILVPWLAADLVTAWFCFSLMKNEPLEDSKDQSPQAESLHE